VDGIILFSVQFGDAFEKQLAGMQVPIVAIGNRISNTFTYVGINERESMKDAVKYVLREGYEHIIYVCPPLANRGEVNLYTLEERLAGCREALAENGSPEPIVITDKNFIEVIDNMDWESPPRKAVVCPADYYALEVLSFFKKKKIRVPEQVGIMGFDDIDMLKYINPRLCTVRYPSRDIADMAVNCLVEQMNGNQNNNLNALILQHKIVEGESL
jgi:LacI family transcriptional regulator